MKKRIFSLLLVLVMLLSLCLVSCEEEEAAPSAQPSPVPPPKAIPIEYISNSKPSIPSTNKTTVTTTKVNSVTIPDEAYCSHTYTFNYFSGNVELYLMSLFENYDTQINEYNYMLVSTVTGQTYSFTVSDTFLSNGDAPAGAIVDYSIATHSVSLAWAGITLSVAYEDGSFTHILFDAYLNKIASAKSDSFSPNISSSYGITYYEEIDGDDYFATVDFEGYKFEISHFSNYAPELPYEVDVVKTPSDADVEDDEDEDEEPMFNFDAVTKDEVNGGYYTISENTYIRFNEKGEIISSQYLGSFPADCFNSEIAFLKNGNIFVQYVAVLDQNATSYDAWISLDESLQIKLDITSYIFNVADGSIKYIDNFAYILSGELEFADSERIKELEITEGKNFAFEPMIINAYGTVEPLRDTIVVFDDDMNVIKHIKLVDGDKEYTVLKNGAIVCYDEFSSYLVDANGNKVAGVPHGTIFNCNLKWFVSETDIRDTTYNVIYDFASAGREIFEVYDETILFVEDYTDGEGTTYERLVLWKGVGSEIVLGKLTDYNNNRIWIEDFGFVSFTEDDAEGLCDATIYSLNGEIIKSVQRIDEKYLYTTYIRDKKCYEIVLYREVFSEYTDENGDFHSKTDYPIEHIYIYTSVEHAK